MATRPLIRRIGSPALTLAAVMSLFGICTGAQAAAGPPLASAEFRVTTPDSVELVMTWMSDLREDTLPVPVVMLLPMMNHDRSSWHGFDTLLVRRGFKVVSVDQRGHGASLVRAGEAYKWREFSNSDFARMADDIGEIIAASHELASKTESHDSLDSILTGADFSRIVVVGASIGTSAALLYGADHAAVSGLVLLSPGLNYRGLATVPAMVRYRGRPVYLAAGKDDTRSATAVDSLYFLSDGDSEAARARVIHAGSRHGTDLFENNPGYREEIVDWIAAVLKLRD